MVVVYVKGVQQMIVNLSGIFASRVYKGAAFLHESVLMSGTMYYQLSTDVIEKVNHLAKVLGIEKLVFTSRLSNYLACERNGCLVDYSNNTFNVFAIRGFKPLLFSMARTGTLKY